MSDNSHNHNNRLIIIAVFIGLVTAPFAISSVNVVIPDIINEFSLTALAANWIPTIFMLSNTALILPGGRLADNYGRKKIYIIGTIMLIIGSLLSLLANSFWLLLFGRLIQGMGSGFVFSSALALIVSVTEAKKRAFYIALVSMAVYVGLTIGPLFGGFLGEYYGWRSTFFILIPSSMVILTILMFTKNKDWKASKKRPLDVIGSVLLAITMACFILGTTFINDFYGLWLLLLAGGLLILFVFSQKRRQYPLIQFDLLRINKPLHTSILSSCLMYSGNYPLLFLLSLYLQYVFALNPLEAGFHLFWQMLAMTISAYLAARLSTRISIKKTALTGVAMFAIGMVILNFAIDLSSTLLIQIALFIIGLGFGLFSSPNNAMGLSDINVEQVGMSSSLLNFARVLGNIIGGVVVILLTAMIIGQVAITANNLHNFVLTTKMMTVTSSLFAIITWLLIYYKQKDCD